MKIVFNKDISVIILTIHIVKISIAFSYFTRISVSFLILFIYINTHIYSLLTYTFAEVALSV